MQYKYLIVLSKRTCLNKRAPSTFWWNILLKIGKKLVKNVQNWLENLYNVPQDRLNSPRCLSMRRERLFGTIRYCKTYTTSVSDIFSDWKMSIKACICCSGSQCLRCSNIIEVKAPWRNLKMGENLHSSSTLFLIILKWTILILCVRDKLCQHYLK